MAARVRQHDPMYRAVGAYLKGVRLAQGLTQVQVAATMGVKNATVSYYEAGRNRPPLIAYVQWCQALGLDPGPTLTHVYAVMGPRLDRGDRTEGIHEQR